jgi:hypothetical protein
MQDLSERVSLESRLIAYENETWALVKRNDLDGFASYQTD